MMGPRSPLDLQLDFSRHINSYEIFTCFLSDPFTNIKNVGGRWKAGLLVEARMLHIAFFKFLKSLPEILENNAAATPKGTRCLFC